MEEPAICLFIELVKAFDTISHPNLLETLEYIGLKGIPYKSVERYLTNRRHYVTIDNEINNEKGVSYSVPQPILFIPYINSLFSLAILAELIHFSDDTAIFIKNQTFPVIINYFNSKLLRLSW